MENLALEIHIGDGWVSHHREKKGLLNFKYPIFNVLIPMNLANTEVVKFLGFWSLALHSKDYLDGRDGNFKEKIYSFLDKNLKYQPHEVILQTIPRMFGYAFNPVSFWYCFKNNTLDAVLCEVNNTFGDRHYYFVDIKENKSHVLKKDFHVSPFFAIEGFYQFEFKLDEKSSVAKINYFQNEQSRLLSTTLNLNISALNQISQKKLLMKYGWMTLLIIVRIHYLALKLWFKGTQFHKRPQPPSEEISR